MLFAQSNASLSCCASCLFAILLVVMLVIVISGCCLFHVVAYVVLSLCFEPPILCLFVRFYAQWSQSGHGGLFHRPHQGSCPNPTRQSTIFIILVVWISCYIICVCVYVSETCRKDWRALALNFDPPNCVHP